MTGQPKKKLLQVEQFADRCYATAMHGTCIIPRHYLNRERRQDPRDEIARYYEGSFTWSMMLCLVSEKLENLLRAKAGLEPRRSRFDEARQRSEADKGDLEQQFEQESERLAQGWGCLLPPVAPAPRTHARVELMLLAQCLPNEGQFMAPIGGICHLTPPLTVSRMRFSHGWGGGVVERAGLENRYTLRGIAGSNPAPTVS